MTNDLRSRFKTGGKSWGAARKGLNLFFRDVVYNTYLADYLNIPNNYSENNKILSNLEVPLDRDVATGLRFIKSLGSLPKWKSIKDLTESHSKFYQDKALIYANQKGIARVHLDLVFWRNRKEVGE